MGRAAHYTHPQMIVECFTRLRALAASTHHHLGLPAHHVVRHFLHHARRANSLGATLSGPAPLSTKVCVAIGLAAAGVGGLAADVPARVPIAVAAVSHPPSPPPVFGPLGTAGLPDPSMPFDPGDPGGLTDPASLFDPQDPGDPPDPRLPPAAVPEPPSLAMLGLGLLGVMILRGTALPCPAPASATTGAPVGVRCPSRQSPCRLSVSRNQVGASFVGSLTYGNYSMTSFRRRGIVIETPLTGHYTILTYSSVDSEGV
jgi:hypothetical protein